VLRGTYRRNFLGRPSASDWLRQAAGLWRELEPDLVDLRIRDVDGVPTLSIQAHPAVEHMEVTIPAGGQVVVSANTSTGGPGYHRRMCDVMHILGNTLGVIWRPSTDDALDDTRYFETGDRSAVDTEMLAWLAAVLGRSNVPKGQRLAIAMPLGYRTGGDDDIVTSMGPRDQSWVTRGAADPREAADLFAWWGDDRDAVHYRNRALATMWVDLRWATPLDDVERDGLVRVDRDLSRAHELDPTLDLPWREWAEVRRLVGGSSTAEATMTDQMIRERASAVGSDSRLIGYRRGSAPFSLEGWTIQVPGSFVEEWEDGSWVGYDDQRSVRLKSIEIRGEDGTIPTADVLAAAMSGANTTTIAPGDPALRGGATVADTSEGGRLVRLVQGAVTVTERALVVTIVFGDDEAWGRETFRSIRFTSRTNDQSDPNNAGRRVHEAPEAEA
jgi:hypothetical protein